MIDKSSSPASFEVNHPNIVNICGIPLIDPKNEFLSSDRTTEYANDQFPSKCSRPALEITLSQIGNLAVRYLKYRILIGKISGLRWFFTKRGRKFYFAQTFLDDSPTFLVVIKRPETSLFLLVFHLQENFGDI